MSAEQLPEHGVWLLPPHSRRHVLSRGRRRPVHPPEPARRRSAPAQKSDRRTGARVAVRKRRTPPDSRSSQKRAARVGSVAPWRPKKRRAPRPWRRPLNVPRPPTDDGVAAGQRAGRRDPPLRRTRRQTARAWGAWPERVWRAARRVVVWPPGGFPPSLGSHGEPPADRSYPCSRPSILAVPGGLPAGERRPHPGIAGSDRRADPPLPGARVSFAASQGALITVWDQVFRRGSVTRSVVPFSRGAPPQGYAAIVPAPSTRCHEVLRGRRSECEALDRQLQGARVGQSSVQILRARRASAKTALLEYGAERASGCRVVRAAGVQSEMELAFAGCIKCARRCSTRGGARRVRAAARRARAARGHRRCRRRGHRSRPLHERDHRHAQGRGADPRQLRAAAQDPVVGDRELRDVGQLMPTRSPGSTPMLCSKRAQRPTRSSSRP